MVALDSFQSYVWMFLLAAGVGAIGGLGAELIQMRDRETGLLVPPARRPAGLQLGSVATVLIGALAAVTVLYFFPPEVIVRDSATGTETRHYEIVKFVALALIAGLAGLSVLNSARASVVAQLKTQSAKTTKAVAKVAVENAHLTEQSVAADAANAAVVRGLPSVQLQVEEAARETPLDVDAVLRSIPADQLSDLGASFFQQRIPPTDAATRLYAVEGLVQSMAEEVRQSTEAGLQDRIQASLRAIDALPE